MNSLLEQHQLPKTFNCTRLRQQTAFWYKAQHKEVFAVPLEAYLVRIVDLIVCPFRHMGSVWGILPVYTSLILGELYKSKVSFSHAVCNGFVMLWAGLNWSQHLAHASITSYLLTAKALAWIVTACCIGLGVFTIVLGFRKKDKALCEQLVDLKTP